jgi:hypothetical protein
MTGDGAISNLCCSCDGRAGSNPVANLFRNNLDDGDARVVFASVVRSILEVSKVR